MKCRIREPFNGFSHLIGALLSIVGLIFLIKRALGYGTISYLVSFTIFGLSLILLYTASALYHLLQISERVTKALRYVDHMMIFILIAGSYTPICMIALKGTPGKVLLSIVWTLAAIGIVAKGLWLNAPRWLSSLIYGAMGWMIISTLPKLFRALTPSGFAWLLAGGIFYTIGAVIYGIKRPNLPFKMGFHEIFHLFILAGSVCHYWTIFSFV